MPTPRLTKELAQEALNALEEYGQATQKAAESIGIAKSTLQSRIQRAKTYGLVPESKDTVIYPDIPDDKIETGELIEKLKARFAQRQETEKARNWMKFKMNIEGPFGLAFVGDPHMDDNGCNWPLLERDMKLLQTTPALYGVGLGDYTNNWSGYLSQRLHPYQETTRDQAWQLAEWMFGLKKDNDESIWFLLIKGNHDLWSGTHGTGDPLDWMERGKAPLEDWQAKFQVECMNGKHVKIWAAHDFKGSSIYNPLHGPMRKAKFSGAIAGMFVCGDKHNWACFETEHEDTLEHIWCARARGYKYIDDYATKLGYESQQYGATITAIIDPEAKGITALRCFPELEEAVEFLTWKRKDI